MQFENFLRFQILDEHNASFHMSGTSFPNPTTKIIKSRDILSFCLRFHNETLNFQPFMAVLFTRRLAKGIS